MTYNIYFSLLIMCGTVYLIRLLPLLFLRKPITNKFIRSFLHYVPYVTLAVMTFPAMMDATQSPLAGLLALAAGCLLAWFGGNLFQVAVLCCLMVLAAEFFLI